MGRVDGECAPVRASTDPTVRRVGETVTRSLSVSLELVPRGAPRLASIQDRPAGMGQCHRALRQVVRRAAALAVSVLESTSQGRRVDIPRLRCGGNG